MLQRQVYPHHSDIDWDEYAKWVSSGFGDEFFQAINGEVTHIYDTAGAPGANAFRDSARRAGIDIAAADSRPCVAQQSSRQVFKQRIASDGNNPSGGREDT